MAESADSPVDELLTTQNPAESKPGAGSARRKQVLLGLGVAVGILLLAWYIAGRAGLGDLGNAGVNSNLLPKVGEEAPDFVAISPEGQVVHLSDFRGQPVWLNFWGSWCPPCRAEMPDIQSAYQELQPQGLTLLAVSLGDKPSEAMNFAELNGVTFDILLDPDRSLTSPTYPIYNFPTHIFIDKDGIVRKIVLSEMSTEQAVAAAQSILPEQAAIEPDDAH
ncbi:MAG TPA: redoxin domain-containing protein [Thermomicrobiales bacterium]|nr:redoxin domain-containing protein [Thermomicrobiales bacterium]